VVVNLLGFKVNLFERNSILSFGPVQEIDIYLSTKRNQGFGEQNGDLTTTIAPLNIANDQDVSDSNSAKGSVV
jgi:hypothetical protein